MQLAKPFHKSLTARIVHVLVGSENLGAYCSKLQIASCEHTSLLVLRLTSSFLTNRTAKSIITSSIIDLSLDFYQGLAFGSDHGRIYLHRETNEDYYYYGTRHQLQLLNNNYT